MLSLTYLSKADRDRQQEIEKESLLLASLRGRPTLPEHDHLLLGKTVEERLVELQEENTELEARRKPLSHCSVDECTEFKAQVYEKYNKLQNLGKTQIALQLRNMIHAIEQRIYAIHLEAMRNPVQKVNPIAHRTKVKEKKIASAGKPRTGGNPVSNPWAVDLDDVD